MAAMVVVVLMMILAAARLLTVVLAEVGPAAPDDDAKIKHRPGQTQAGLLGQTIPVPTCQSQVHLQLLMPHTGVQDLVVVVVVQLVRRQGNQKGLLA